MNDRPCCRLCGSLETHAFGRPAYRIPTEVAGVAIDISDLSPRLYRCQACTYEFTHPPVPLERLLSCYRAAKQGHWRTDDQVAVRRRYGHKKELLDLYAPGRRVLDFGCFDAGFLTYLGLGYERYGVEPSEQAAEVAEQRGVRVLAPVLDDPSVGSAAPFDAIVSFDVFEHLLEPELTFATIARLLRPGGVLMVETGNTDTKLWRLLKGRYPYCATVSHVGFFNRASFARAAERHGLELVHFERTEHSRPPASAIILEMPLYTSAYLGLMMAEKLRLPLPQRVRRVAAGPLPRAHGVRDHFLAIARRRP